jgi:hypothetical protein
VKEITSSSSSSSSHHQQPPATATTSIRAEGNRLQLYSFSSANDKISDKTKHIMKISHINVNIYDKAVTSQQK